MNRQRFLLISCFIAGLVYAQPEKADPQETPPPRESVAESPEKPAPSKEQTPPVVLPKKDPDAPVIPKYCVPTKPATMESEAFRRAKRNHRGLPIDGCAPVPRHLMRERFGDPDPRPPKQAS